MFAINSQLILFWHLINNKNGKVLASLKGRISKSFALEFHENRRMGGKKKKPVSQSAKKRKPKKSRPAASQRWRMRFRSRPRRHVVNTAFAQRIFENPRAKQRSVQIIGAELVASISKYLSALA